MIIRWGRKGLVAAAFAVAFVTPSATTPTTIHKADLHPGYKQVVRHVTPSSGVVASSTINKVDLRPSYKQIVRHITPSGDVAPATTIRKADLLPSYKQVVRHITPVDQAVVADTGGGGSKLALLLREDQEIIDIITAIGPILVRMV